MRSGSLARWVVAALALCPGTAAAADNVAPQSAPATPPGLAAPTAPAASTPAASASAQVLGGTGACPEPVPSWARVEFLSWCLTGGRLPPLTILSPPGTPVAAAGLPGVPGAVVLFGGDRPLDDPRSGARLTVGTWLDPALGVEASVFWLEQETAGLTVSSDGSAIIGSSPFIDANTGAPSRVLVSYPGVVAGTADTTYTGRAFWGAEALVRVPVSGGCGWRVDGLAGYRYREYEESLDIRKTLRPLGPAFVPGTTILCVDGFDTATRFHGAAVGFECLADHGCWAFAVRPTLGIGWVETSVRRTGFTTISVPGTPPVTYPGGTYNLVTNLGTVREWDCTVVPELDVRVSRAVCDGVRVTVGYSALYLPLAARAGDQIDPVVNPNFIPPPVGGGPLRPARFLDREPALLHGLTVGVEVRF